MRSARFPRTSFRSVSHFAALTAMFCAFASVSAKEKDEAVAQWKKRFNEEVLDTLKSKCITCHNEKKKEGELDLSKFADGEQAFVALEMWEQVARRVRVNEMPPEGSPRLNDDQKGKLLRWLDSRPNQNLCNSLASDETMAWYRGYVMSRRITRAEYNNILRDLLGVDLHLGDDLPADGSGGTGFDTAGDALFTSTIHIEKYLAAAHRAIETVLPDNGDGQSTETADARKRILFVAPSPELTEREAAKKIIERFGRRAWRRPLEAEEIERLLGLYDSVRTGGKSHLAGVRQSLKAMLVSSHFLFVVETETGEGGERRLTPHQLATRLSLFIWSSMPDDELSKLADDGKIIEPEILRAQVKRMLKDPKSRALGENFGLQWLGLATFTSGVRPDGKVFPEFNSALAADMREEAVELVYGVFRDDRDLFDLVDADYAFVNARLAEHYGLPKPSGNAWQRVSLPDHRRGGVITLGAVLTTTSYPLRTSPVLRGKWILEELLGSKVPPPPPNVPALEETHAEEGKKMTMRERLEVHRRKSECASCHDRMDPLGFGLENFDAIGRWRTDDDGIAVDAAGKLPSGEKFAGPDELKKVLMKRKDEFSRHFTKKLVGYALGRDLTRFDDCVVNESQKKMKENGNRASILIEEIALSYPFQHRYFKKAK